jgi:hypothetical protein
MDAGQTSDGGGAFVVGVTSGSVGWGSPFGDPEEAWRIVASHLSLPRLVKAGVLVPKSSK